MEGVLAAFAQFDNDVRSERTRGGMRAALELAMDLPRSPWLPERASFVGQEPDSRSGPSATGASRLPGFRHWTVHERRSPQERDRAGPHSEARQTGAVRDIRRNATESCLHRPERCAGLQRVDPRRLRTARQREIFFGGGILDGRLEIASPRHRNDPDLLLRGCVNCAACGNRLTAS